MTYRNNPTKAIENSMWQELGIKKLVYGEYNLMSIGMGLAIDNLVTLLSSSNDLTGNLATVYSGLDSV